MLKLIKVPALALKSLRDKILFSQGKLSEYSSDKKPVIWPDEDEHELGLYVWKRYRFIAWIKGILFRLKHPLL